MVQKFEINVKNMVLTNRIQEYVEKKVPRLERLLPGIDNMKFDLSYSKSMRNRSIAKLSRLQSLVRDLSSERKKAMLIC